MISVSLNSRNTLYSPVVSAGEREEGTEELKDGLVTQVPFVLQATAGLRPGNEAA